MDDRSLITLENVCCSYFVRKSRVRLRRVEVLRNISMCLQPGEILGVIGSNGAGKSTLLRILARIMLPNEGRITHRPGLTVSLLTLMLGFCEELTGRDNAMLGAMYMGYTKAQAEARLERILSFAELDDWVNEPIRTYSMGMRARLGFAVALEMEPDVMLVDEVLGVGDAYFQKKSLNALRNKMHGGMTTVLVLHDAGAIASLCSRVIWIADGGIRMTGEPAPVLAAYDEFVASLGQGSSEHT